MTTQPKKQPPEVTKQPDSADGSVHPETGQRVNKSGVPGDESSKAASTTQHDGRTSHDRDGNTQQRKTAGERHD